MWLYEELRANVGSACMYNIAGTYIFSIHCHINVPCIYIYTYTHTYTLLSLPVMHMQNMGVVSVLPKTEKTCSFS